jgi:hypothetical protein
MQQYIKIHITNTKVQSQPIIFCALNLKACSLCVVQQETFKNCEFPLTEALCALRVEKTGAKTKRKPPNSNTEMRLSNRTIIFAQTKNSAQLNKTNPA